MHGTGTPLGDPIELGAAVAVLPGSDMPVRMTAAKSRMGHAEPAAGRWSPHQISSGKEGNDTLLNGPQVSTMFSALLSQYAWRAIAIAVVISLNSTQCLRYKM